MKFNLKQLSLSFGIFCVLSFLVWWGFLLIFPGKEIHRQLLLEMIPGAVWPLSLGMVLLGIAGSFTCGVICGSVFGWLFNSCAPKK